jgi:(p)ppGpp synthase/HD superfamily hydrolase
MQMTARFTEAFAFAAALHRDQMRKTSEPRDTDDAPGIPYISHLMSVAALALENGADEDVAIAALLHDAVEDRGGQATAKLIGELFGERVQRIVVGCSDTDVRPKPPWKERKLAYIAHLKDADSDTRLVSLCDKVHNARSIVRDFNEVGVVLWSRFSEKDPMAHAWYYRALASELQRDNPPALWEELRRLVEQIERAAVTSPCHGEQ